MTGQCCFIIPNRVLEKLLPPDEARAQAQANAWLRTARLHQASILNAGKRPPPSARPGIVRVYDAHHERDLPGTLVIDDASSQATADAAAREASANVTITQDFYRGVYNRRSVDGRGLTLDSSVHYGVGYDNAFWNGGQMVYGDGRALHGFTGALDVIAHELTHGVTQYTVPPSGLLYAGQPGALNESVSDVFGVQVVQWHLGQDVTQADWLIGATLGLPDGKPLRSLASPKDGYDPQPDDMKDFVILPNDEPDDWGGVHTNSGIPNHAFYLMAMDRGGHSWETVGPVWYRALAALREKPSATFSQFAAATIDVARQMSSGPKAALATTVRNAWKKVGVAR